MINGVFITFIQSIKLVCHTDLSNLFMITKFLQGKYVYTNFINVCINTHICIKVVVQVHRNIEKKNWDSKRGINRNKEVNRERERKSEKDRKRQKGMKKYKDKEAKRETKRH